LGVVDGTFTLKTRAEFSSSISISDKTMDMLVGRWVSSLSTSYLCAFLE
jgi:hypothetical protein